MRISREDAIIAFILFLVSISLLFAFRSIQFVGDSLAFAWQFETGDDLVNAHHLIYEPLYYWLLKAAKLVIPKITAVGLLQFVNAAYAAVGVGVFYLISRKFMTVIPSIIASLVFLISHKYWLYATQMEVYVPASVWMMLVLLIILYTVSIRWQHILAMSFCWIISVLFNQMSVLYAIPMLIILWQKDRRKGIVDFVKLSLVSGSVVLLAYIINYAMVAEDFGFSGFNRFVFGYAYLHPDWGTAEHFTNLAEFHRLFLNQLEAYIPDELAVKLPILPFAIFTILLIGWHTYKSLKPGKPYLQLTRTFLLSTLVVHYLFLLWWTAGNEFFVTLVYVYLLLVIILLYDILNALSESIGTKLLNKALPVALSIMFVSLVVLNFNTFKEIHTKRSSSYKLAEYIDETSGNTCVAMVGYNIQQYLQYNFRFNDVVETEGVYLNYYHLEEKRPRFFFEPEQCKIMPLWNLNPWYNSLGNTGWDKPEDWFRLFSDMFEIREKNGRIDCKAFQLRKLNPETDDLIFIKNERYTFNSLLELFQTLDQEILNAGIEREAVYVEWYEKNKNVVE